MSAKSHPATLPVTPCSVVWSGGHPWVLDGEPGIPSPRRWVGLDDAGTPQVRTAAAMRAHGFSVIYVDTDGEAMFSH